MTPAGPEGDGVHPTLARQLRRLKLSAEDAPTADRWQAFLADVSGVYVDIDNDRGMLERVVEISSKEMESLNRRLTHQAATDPLTGLLNRASLMDELNRLLSPRSSEETQGLAVLFIDLDGFKLINDRLGHAAGDRVLSVVADRLRRSTRPDDVVARLGGDEFVVIGISLSEPDAAVACGERVIAALSGSVELPGRIEVGVGASIGIALATGDGSPTADELLANADAAMYRAKMTGRNRIVVHSDGMTVAPSSSHLTDELRFAIADDQLVLHYQPLVCLEHERTVAMEALVRWHHPDRGLLLPADFIPAAEGSELIRELTGWVIERAFEEVSTWPSEAVVTVNLSARDLAGPGLATAVQAAADRVGVDIERVLLEVTESSLMVWDEQTASGLSDLVETGVRLAIDDFGRGYSSLAQLQSLPVGVVKLDRAFVERVHESITGQAIVRAVVEMANALGLVVVAEGIEAKEQAQHLRSLGCRFGQGFFFGRPSATPNLDAIGCRECGLAPVPLP